MVVSVRSKWSSASRVSRVSAVVQKCGLRVSIETHTKTLTLRFDQMFVHSTYCRHSLAFCLHSLRDSGAAQELSELTDFSLRSEQSQRRFL